MGQYSKECIEVFLKDQGKLFDLPVAETAEEAEEFLEDCMAEVLPDIKSVRKYLDRMGMDVTSISDDELKEEAEVFALPSGGFLLVEG